MNQKYLYIFILLVIPIQIQAYVKLTPLDTLRVKEIANIMDSTSGYGVPYQERDIWDSLYNVKKYKYFISKAEKLLNSQFPEWNDSLFLIFSKKGSRPEGEKMMAARRNWLPVLVWAECLENKNRFTSTIEKVLVELCNQPTWVLPAHDRYLENFEEKNPSVDLAAATQANELGQTIFLLNDKINDNVRKLVTDKLYQRIFNPVLKSIRTLDNRHFWLTLNNNWNSVCIAGVTAAALAVIPDKELRAEFVAIAEKYSKNGIDGYLDDGYCVEGLGYYNYGFGNFILLREAIWRATKGKIDLFNEQKIIEIAKFGIKSEIVNGVYPSIADCQINTLPSPWILWYLDANLSLTQSQLERKDISLQKTPNLLIDMLVAFTNSSCKLTSHVKNKKNNKLRSYFEHAGVLISRPDSMYLKEGIAVAIKGGNNGESHNHNDVGSYTIVCGNETLMGDPGGPSAYTDKTFTSERYNLYKAFSSWGHPVPLIDGTEQFESNMAQAIILDTIFSDKKDFISMDISSAYKVKDLKSIQRKFTYTRCKNGSFHVEDIFVANKPINFETAITTRYKVEFDKNKLKIIGNNCILNIHIHSKEAIIFKESTIKTYGVPQYKRIGISLKHKKENGSIKLTYSLENK